MSAEKKKAHFIAMDDCKLALRNLADGKQVQIHFANRENKEAFADIVTALAVALDGMKARL